VQENLEREKTNKSQAISTRDTSDLFYRGSVLENLIPVEESTKDESFSTLSLSPPITKTGELFFFFVSKRPKSPQGQPQR
jgi:spore cortex formation protein SpoVR/YcgB (stage V sporulation)